jgi:hypothetical protein
MQRFTKHVIFFILILLTIASCRSKKTFNGVETLKCTTFKESKKETKNKKNSKYEIVVLKDGKRITGKQKRRRKGKSRLFKKR